MNDERDRSDDEPIDVIATLEGQGILSPRFLSEETLRAIRNLDQDDVDALLRINRKVSLNAFFDARGPQYG